MGSALVRAPVHGVVRSEVRERSAGARARAETAERRMVRGEAGTGEARGGRVPRRGDAGSRRARPGRVRRRPRRAQREARARGGRSKRGAPTIAPCSGTGTSPTGRMGKPEDNAYALTTALPTLSRLPPTSSTGPTTTSDSIEVLLSASRSGADAALACHGSNSVWSRSMVQVTLSRRSATERRERAWPWPQERSTWYFALQTGSFYEATRAQW